MAEKAHVEDAKLNAPFYFHEQKQMEGEFETAVARCKQSALSQVHQLANWQIQQELVWRQKEAPHFG